MQSTQKSHSVSWPLSYRNIEIIVETVIPENEMDHAIPGLSPGNQRLKSNITNYSARP